MSRFRPLLAARKRPDLDALHYPKLGSPKFDGIRCLPINQKLYSRKLKLIPNRQVQSALQLKILHKMDGELIYGDPTALDCYGQTESHVMSHDKDASGVKFYVFDWHGEPDWAYAARLNYLRDQKFPKNVILVEQVVISSAKEALDYEETMVGLGFEGAILRSMTAPYKYGRSTLREEYLLKLKQFEDGEGVILRVEPQMENTNVATLNELGYTKRSSAKVGMKAKAILGRVIVRDDKTKLELPVGNGLGWTLEWRTWAWKHPEELVGQRLKYRWQREGMKDRPRFIRAKMAVGFRSKID